MVLNLLIPLSGKSTVFYLEHWIYGYFCKSFLQCHHQWNVKAPVKQVKEFPSPRIVGRLHWYDVSECSWKNKRQAHCEGQYISTWIPPHWSSPWLSFLNIPYDLILLPLSWEFDFFSWPKENHNLLVLNMSINIHLLWTFI